MAKGSLEVIRNRMLAVAVCGSLAVSGLGFTGSAEARVPGGARMSLSARICGSIQDSWDNAKATRDNPSSTAQQKATASDEMRLMVESWYARGCDKLYGRIARMELSPQLPDYQGELTATTSGASQTNTAVPQLAAGGEVTGGSIQASK